MDPTLEQRRQMIEDALASKNNPAPDTRLERLQSDLSLAKLVDSSLQGAANARAAGYGGQAASYQGIQSDPVKAELGDYLEQKKLQQEMADKALLAQLAPKKLTPNQQTGYVVKGTNIPVVFANGQHMYTDPSTGQLMPIPASGVDKIHAPHEGLNIKITSDQAQKASAANIGDLAEKQYNEALAAGKYDPTSYSEWLSQQTWTPNLIKKDDAIKAQSAENAWVEAYLRDVSGAAIGKDERQNYARDFFPRSGDTPEVVANKAELRKARADAVKIGAGPAWTKLHTPEVDQRYSKTFAPAPTQAPTQQPAKKHDWE